MAVLMTHLTLPISSLNSLLLLSLPVLFSIAFFIFLSFPPCFPNTSSISFQHSPSSLSPLNLVLSFCSWSLLCVSVTTAALLSCVFKATLRTDGTHTVFSTIPTILLPVFKFESLYICPLFSHFTSLCCLSVYYK